MKLSRQTRTRLKFGAIGAGAVGAVLLTAWAVGASANAQYAPPVSEKVSEYYETHKNLPAKTAAQAAPVVAYIGDSYSAGAGASAPALRWTSLLSSEMGWSETNVAKGGTGYLATSGKAGCGLDYCPNYREMIPEAVKAKPSIVIVSGGRNDGPSDESAAAVTAFFQDLRKALPEAKIIVTSPIWDDDVAPGTLVEYAAIIKALAVDVGATYVDIGEPLVGHRDFVATDGVHPNDKGHAAIKAAVKVKL